VVCRRFSGSIIKKVLQQLMVPGFFIYVENIFSPKFVFQNLGAPYSSQNTVNYFAGPWTVKISRQAMQNIILISLTCSCAAISFIICAHTKCNAEV